MPSFLPKEPFADSLHVVVGRTTTRFQVARDREQTLHHRAAKVQVWRRREESLPCQPPRLVPDIFLQASDIVQHYHARPRRCLLGNCNK